MASPQYVITYGATTVANNATFTPNGCPAAPPPPKKEKTPLEWLDERVEKVVTKAGF